MPKKVISIKNFKLGLDRRRAEISSVPGALFIAKDGHINTGGEFEKRKAFIQYANLAILDTNGSQGTFGLKSTIDGLYTFGSAYLFSDKQTTHRATAANVATLTLGANHSFVVGDLIDVVGITGYTASNVAVTAASSTTISYANVHANEATTVDVTGTVRIHQTLSQPRLVSAIPAGISYQRLLHPAISDGVTYDATKYRMTGIVHATTFNNLVWDIAQFADGYQFPYYNAELVQDFVAGYILPYQAGNNVLIAKHLTRLVNLTSDYTAVQQPNPNDYKLTITGPIGNGFNLSKEVDTAGTGDLTVPTTSSGTPTFAVAGLTAVGSFKIMGGTASAGVNKITNVKVNAIEILNVAVDWVTSNEVTATAVAAQINSYASTPDYTALASGNMIILSAVTAGAATNNFLVQVTVAGDVCIGDWLFSLTSGGSGIIPVEITSVMVDGIDLLGGVPVLYTTSFSNTASLLATAIRAYGGAVSYVATSSGASVRVSKKVTSSSDAPISAFVNANGIGIGIGNDPVVFPTFTAVVVLSDFIWHPVTHGGQTLDYQTATATVVVTGGTPPYAYAWYTLNGVNVSSAFTGPSYSGFVTIDSYGTPGPYYYAVVIDSTLLQAQTPPF